MDSLQVYSVVWLALAAVVAGLIVMNSNLDGFTAVLRSNESLKRQISQLNRLRKSLWFGILLLVTVSVVAAGQLLSERNRASEAIRASVWPVYNPETVWKAPHISLAETDDDAGLIAYGRDLIAHTQDYFGPSGLVRPDAINGLNCQSCHLDAGSRPFGNNYFAVASTYPQQRARSGSLETIPKRINDCFQRSLNGQPLDTTSREMRAIVAYMRWLGTGVPKDAKPRGTGLPEVPFLERPASPELGREVYVNKCASCHGADGQGLPIPPDGTRHYPPLWGEKSYNQGAGLFRMSRLAGYVKANMPFGATYENPQLTDEEAWDVAAYINAQPRPEHPFLATDWPDISKKPYDHPFGPYRDSFPEAQHKYGPFRPIVAFYKKK
ncbi:MAG: c-type cytochrome [Bacteroidota bacterium]|jgi:thiosulfate dehydrogenase